MKNKDPHKFNPRKSKFQAWIKCFWRSNIWTINIIVFVATALVSILKVIFDNNVDFVFVTAAFVSLIVLIINLFVQPFVMLRRDMKNMIIIDNPNADKIRGNAANNLTKFYKDNEYTTLVYAGEALINSEIVDEYLYGNCEKISLKVSKKKQILPEEGMNFLAGIVKKKVDDGTIIYNRDIVGMRDDLSSGIRLLSLEKTDYYTCLATNDVLSKCVKSKAKAKFYVEGSIFTMTADGQMLCNLETSVAANIIGACTLALTADNQIIVCNQGVKNDVNSNKYVPSGAGNVDFADSRTLKNLEQLLVKTIERELMEELFLEKAKDLTIKTKIISFNRIVSRGGKPDFFGISVINKSADEISGIYKRNSAGTLEIVNVTFIPIQEILNKNEGNFLKSHEQSPQLRFMFDIIRRYKAKGIDLFKELV